MNRLLQRTPRPWLGSIAVGLVAASLAFHFTHARRRSQSGNNSSDSLTRLVASPPSNADAIVPSALDAERIQRAQVLDPATDGWESEAVSDRVSVQLSKLTELLKHPEQQNESSFEPLVSDRFTCPTLRGTQRETRFRDDTFVITRDRVAAETPAKRSAVGASDRQHAFTAFARLLQEAGASYASGHITAAKFKVVDVQLGSDVVTTRQLFTANGEISSGMAEQDAVWIARWTRPTDTDSLPKLLDVRVESWEETTTRTPHGPLYADCTQAVIGTQRAFQEQLAYGIDHWLLRLESLLVGPFGHHGLALGDVNGDDREDLYVCQPGGLPNLLLIHNEDGTVSEMGAEAGVDLLDFTRAALLIDVDNDGDQDLVLATMSHVVCFANDGTGHFTQKLAVANIRDAHSLAAADFNRDGRLDLYVCIYSGDGEATRGSPTPIPIHDARNGGRNILLRNDLQPGISDWKFTDVTNEVGLDADNRRWSYAASWEDYDADGDIDLYVANDFGRNTLYRNDGDHFVEASSAAGLGESGFGMSIGWGDANQDGWVDVYVGNMFSSAGNRITNQAGFAPEASDTMRKTFRFTARGNSLFLNNGDGTFRDVSVEAGVTMGRWAWSSIFSDINSDGRPDLLVGNGFITRENTEDL